ncbi:MAG: right-handed parallel beta-helix repeat-containing protein [bacterium]
MKRTAWSIVLVSVWLLALSHTLEAATLVVPSLDHPTIQQAVSSAREGDTVFITPGIYRENLTIEGKFINLQGSKREATILDGGNKAPCLILKNGSNGQIQNLTIRHGNAKSNGGEGGGIACYQSNPVIHNNIFQNNVADRGMGGAIFCFQSSPVIKNNEFYCNSAAYGEGGAIYVFRSNPTLSHNTFTENLALKGEGGAVSLIESKGKMTGNVLTGNKDAEGKHIHMSNSKAQ